MTQRFVFGYGSLVNRRTHEYTQAHAARVTGWQRAWRRTPLRERCFLTVVPMPGAQLYGLAAAVPEQDWAALDAREQGYTRHMVAAVPSAAGNARQVALYAIPPERFRPPGPDDHLALSYIDTVVAGFVAEYGPEGAAQFFATTSGWEATVLDDRAAPLYARAQPVGAAVRRLTDEGIARVGAAVTRL